MLERTKNSRVWVDQTFCGWDDTLSAPQVFDVTKAMSPGKHTITVLVDNSVLPPVGPAHAVDERTQTNWNGIVGRMELKATDPVWIDEVQVVPDIKANAVKGVMIAASFAAARDHLATGGKVLLLPAMDKLPHSVGGSFQTDFLSPMFAQAAKKQGIIPPAGTLGILCNPKSPALAGPLLPSRNWPQTCLRSCCRRDDRAER